jgi:urea transport system ATP-binding protein
VELASPVSEAAGSGDGDGSREASIILEIEDAVAKLNATSGLPILLVEQYMEFALRLATRYVVLDAGRVAASGKTSTFDPATVRPLLAV